MKRITIIIGLICVFGTVYCQDVQVPMNKSYYEKFFTPQKEYYGYLTIGASLPRGQFKQVPSLDKPLLDPFIGKDGMGGTTGLFVDAGVRLPFGGFYSNKNQLFPTYSFGMEVALNDINWTGVGSSMANVESTSFLFFGLKLGGGLSYNLRDKFVFEFTYDMGLPLISEFPTLSNHGENDHRLNFNIEDDYSESPSSTFKPTRSWVLAIRKNNFRFSIDWFRYNAEQMYEFTSYDTSGNQSTKKFVAKMPWTTTKVGLGVIF